MRSASVRLLLFLANTLVAAATSGTVSCGLVERTSRFVGHATGIFAVPS